MNENIFWVVSAKVKEGELENLKALMNEMVESTMNEPDTINYEWFISDDNKYCHLYERYKNSDAAVIHMKSFVRDFVKRFVSVLDIKSNIVYGTLSDELEKMLTPMGAVFMKPLGGFKK